MIKFNAIHATSVTFDVQYFSGIALIISGKKLNVRACEMRCVSYLQGAI